MRLTGLRLEQVSRRFGRYMALRNVSVGFEAGQVVLLLGPNGAGKTTLLRLASTLLPATRGRLVASIEQQGQAHEVDLMELAKVRRDFVGLVSHSSLLYEELTGRENLELFARLYGLGDKEAQERSAQLLARLDLDFAAERRAAGYSRGMRQRLSIARAMLQSPSLILLDEPFTGLDQDGRRIVFDVLRDLRQQGALVMMVTHFLTLPPDLVDRAVLLKGGQVVRDGAVGQEGVSAWYERGLVEA